jgi:hypothetical protein
VKTLGPLRRKSAPLTGAAPKGKGHTWLDPERVAEVGYKAITPVLTLRPDLAGALARLAARVERGPETSRAARKPARRPGAAAARGARKKPAAKTSRKPRKR